MTIQNKRQHEQEIVSQMISLYCRKKHGCKQLCPQCSSLEAYAQRRSERCPCMETKTFCSNCKIHCYQPDMRRKIREVMRFSGPRMLLHHPVMAVRHAWECQKERKNMEEKR